MRQKTAVIIGAGPAGLTAAYELIKKTVIKPIIYEMSNGVGGIAKTVNYKGNRIDIGGHRFFSKSEIIIEWWQNILPLQGAPSRDDIILRRHFPLSKEVNAPDPEKSDRVMLIRRRHSRIFFLGRFFDYPLSLNLNTVLNLGFVRIIKIIASYIKIRIFPIRYERSLEDFFINRFSKALYLFFFKDYTQKVWGVPCNKIRPEWGIQRIKGLSITKAVIQAVKSTFLKDFSISQKDRETSLIEQFMYPKLGPGQFWEEVLRIVKEKGAEIFLNHKVIGLKYKDNNIVGVEVRDEMTGEIKTREGDYFFSTMPVKELIRCFGVDVPQEVSRVAQGLPYRDIIVVGLLVKKFKIKNETKIKTINNIIPDNWIYMQEKDVRFSRLQIFNNWSPYIIKDENTVWMGLEYFCNEGDGLWSKSDTELTKFAIDELARINFIEKESVLDSIVIRMAKVYPAYFGTYDQFHIIRNFTDKFENLYLIGRNGMHRYSNLDHSMLTAIKAVENISKGIKKKDNIWSVNIEKEYHEIK